LYYDADSTAGVSYQSIQIAGAPAIASVVAGVFTLA
jgi:hypothetical protein